MAGDRSGSRSGGLARALLRPLGWPFRRILDPRFGGLAAQIDTKQRDLFDRLDALRDEHLRLNHELARRLEKLERIESERTDAELARLLDEHARATTELAGVLGRSFQVLRDDLAEVQAALPPLEGPRTELERRSRSHAKVLPLAHDLAVCRLLGRYHCYLDPTDWPVASYFCLDGVWEPDTTIAIARRLRPGAACIDVGAGYGYFTLLMADLVGPAGSVTAVEPNPSSANLLERNVLVNGFADRASTVRAAADEDSGATRQLVVPEGRAAHASTTLSLDGRTIDVSTCTIDDVAESLDRVDLVKIDVEGAEEAVWRGMRRTIEDNPSICVLLEFNATRYEDPAAFIEALQQPGLALASLAPDGSSAVIEPARLLQDRVGQEWMLVLERDSVH